MRAYNYQFVETAGAIFIIAAVSIFILANFTVGFNLPVYIFATFFGFAISLFFPRSGVYAIIFLTFVFERFFTLTPIYFDRMEYKLYPIDIILAGVILGMAVKLIISGNFFQRSSVSSGHLPSSDIRRIRGFLRSPDLLLAVFILASAVYFLVSVTFGRGDFAVAFSTFKNYFFYSLFYFIILFLFKDKKDLVQFLKFFLAGGIAVVFFIILGIIRGEGLWTEFTPLSTPGARILAFTHGFFLSMALLIALVWLLFKKGGYNNFLYFLAPVWAIGIVGTLMRHLWISLFLSLVFLFLVLPLSKKKKLARIISHYIFLFAVVILATSFLVLTFPDLKFLQSARDVASAANQRFVSTVQVNSDESLNWRKSVWESAWREFKEKPLTGLGYGEKIPVEIGKKYRSFVEVRNIHNSPLALFIQMGVLGMALFVSFAWLIIKQALRDLRIPADNDDYQFLRCVFLALLANYLIAFLFQTYLETNLLGIFFWIILGGLRVVSKFAILQSKKA